MKEKKNRNFGGLEAKYVKELTSITMAAVALSKAAGVVLQEMHRDDSDHGDIQTGWLNSPYQLMQKLERDTAELEAKIKADVDFSEAHKQGFFDAFIDPVKAGNKRARDFDAYIMNGVIPPDLLK